MSINKKIEELKIEGQGSELITKDIKMFSDGFIEVNNKNGNFTLEGQNSKLINEDLIIKAQFIDGNFSDKEDIKDITFLNVLDEQMSYVKNNDTEMYAKKLILIMIVQLLS